MNSTVRYRNQERWLVSIWGAFRPQKRFQIFHVKRMLLPSNTKPPRSLHLPWARIRDPLASRERTAGRLARIEDRLYPHSSRRRRLTAIARRNPQHLLLPLRCLSPFLLIFDPQMARFFQARVILSLLSEANLTSSRSLMIRPPQLLHLRQKLHLPP